MCPHMMEEIFFSKKDGGDMCRTKDPIKIDLPKTKDPIT
jgi:hypothetical protein